MKTRGLSLLPLCLLLAGCSLWVPGQNIKKHFDLSKNIPWGGGSDGQFTRAMKLIAVWQHSVLHQDQHRPVRGFGGRVWFYGPDGEKPVEVDGTLEVYAFDETDRDPTNVQPDRKYVFSSEELQKHHSDNALGHSYSFWLPWGDVNGPPVEISLIARFTPKDGSGSIVGEETKHLLPGRELASGPKKRNPPLTNRAGRAAPSSAPGQGQGINWPTPAQGPGFVTQAAGVTPAAEGMADPQFAANPERRLKVATIDVPARAGRSTPFTTSTVSPPYGNGPIGAYAASGQQWQFTPGAGAAPVTPAAAGLARPEPPQAGYSLAQRRATGAPIERPSRDHSPWQPHHVRLPSGLASPPQWGNASGSGWNSGSGVPGGR
jgi:hypothetical protein